MTVRTAIVGLGRIGSLLENDTLREKPCTHAGAIAANPGLTLCAGADTDEERRRLFAETWGVPVYADTETMLREERPRILHIATHPDSHLSCCALAARYGVSVAVCEKPLADTLAGAKKIAALHESGTITVITNHERRYAADYALAREILSSGERLGPVISVRGTLYMGKTRRLLDVLWHDGTHLADAAMFLSGGLLQHRKTLGSGSGAFRPAGLFPPPFRSAGTAGRRALDTRSVYLLGSLENPMVPLADKARAIPFIMELGAGRDHLVFELEFSCGQGRLRIGNGIFEVWESRESPYAEGFRSLEKTRDRFTDKTGYFSAMAANALACALDRTRIPLSSAADGLRVIRYLHSVGAWRGPV
ncbi:MAG: Gfo/Idh/MocA family oxidoreductase [Treponema sp.]|jgi:predicted dehydrogenase|nr:Gfo/Idh/MocA family oxidoreductase [Treponema sp.]